MSEKRTPSEVVQFTKHNLKDAEPTRRVCEGENFGLGHINKGKADFWGEAHTHSHGEAISPFKPTDKTTQNIITPISKRGLRKRKQNFAAAHAFSCKIGLPLNVAVTIGWRACMDGDRAEGHILGLDDEKRASTLLRRLRELAKRAEHGFAAIWVRALCNHRGLHMHLAIHWPEEQIPTLSDAIGRATGDAVNPGSETRSVLAASEKRGWILQWCARTRDGVAGWLEYLAGQHSKQGHSPNVPGKQVGVTENINSTAQRKWEAELCSM